MQAGGSGEGEKKMFGWYEETLIRHYSGVMTGEMTSAALFRAANEIERQIMMFPQPHGGPQCVPHQWKVIAAAARDAAVAMRYQEYRKS